MSEHRRGQTALPHSTDWRIVQDALDEPGRLEAPDAVRSLDGGLDPVEGDVDLDQQPNHEQVQGDDAHLSSELNRNVGGLSRRRQEERPQGGEEDDADCNHQYDSDSSGNPTVFRHIAPSIQSANTKSQRAIAPTAAILFGLAGAVITAAAWYVFGFAGLVLVLTAYAIGVGTGGVVALHRMEATA